MSQLDYQPRVDGIPVDPAAAGGAVTTLALYGAADHTGTLVTVGPAVAVRPGVYRFTIDDTTTGPGRWWPRVTWTATGGGPALTEDLPDPLDLPTRADLVISAEDLAERLRIPLPLTPAQRRSLTVAVTDAQVDVVAYLGRQILPQVFTERRAWPYGGAERALAEQPVGEVLGEVEETRGGAPTGYWTVTYTAGLNVRDDAQLRPILRLVRAAAANHDLAVALWKTVGGGAATDDTGARQITSLSAEGQSVSFREVRPGGVVLGYGGSNPKPVLAAGIVGEPLAWDTIDRWRVRGRRVFQRGARWRPGYGTGTVTIGS